MEAEYEVYTDGGKYERRACQVVGIDDDGKFIIIVAGDDGAIWTSTADAVWPVSAAHVHGE